MMTDEIASILEKEANAVRNIPVSSNYEEAVNLIVEYVHARGGKLVDLILFFLALFAAF